MVLKTTFNNISGISWRSALLVEENKGNNKITELRTILQGKVKTHNYINRQNQSTTGKL